MSNTRGPTTTAGSRFSSITGTIPRPFRTGIEERLKRFFAMLEDIILAICGPGPPEGEARCAGAVGGDTRSFDPVADRKARAHRRGVDRYAREYADRQLPERAAGRAAARSAIENHTGAHDDGHLRFRTAQDAPARSLVPDAGLRRVQRQHGQECACRARPVQARQRRNGFDRPRGRSHHCAIRVVLGNRRTDRRPLFQAPDHRARQGGGTAVDG